MSNQGLDPQRRLVAERAVDWLISMQSGKLTAKERGELADWLRASPLHVEEMLRVSMIDVDLGEFKNWQKYLKDAQAIEEKGLDSPDDHLIALSEFPAPTPAPRRRLLAAPLVAFAMAAGFAAIAFFSSWLYVGRDESVIRTEIGQQHAFTLADGSVVDVAPDSEVHVQFRKHQRLIALTRGQAFFHVAKDANRPFIVEAANARVRAVGTAFDVEHGTSEVTVTVTEGRVTVTRAPSLLEKVGVGPARSADVFVNANEQIVVGQADVNSAVRPVDGKEAAAWTEGKLIFKSEKVSDAVSKFNLYNRAQILVLDEQLAAQRITGVFNASDPESFVAFVKTTASKPEGNDVILLDQPEN